MKRAFTLIIVLFLAMTNTNAQKPTEMPTGKKFYIQSAMNYGKNNGGYWDLPGVYQPSRAINKGANIQVWNLDAHHDRQFTLVKSNVKGYYEIQVGYTTSSRIDIKGAKGPGTPNGSNVQVWDRTNLTNQRFLFKHLGNGRFKIYDQNSGKALCLAGRKNANGTNVHIWDDHNGPWMEWYLIDVKTKKAFEPSQLQQKITEVKIGEQVWMGENLNVSHFRNGDPIPHASTNKEWSIASKEKKPAWCYYNNDPANGEKYGKLYNWYAVNDPRGLAPKGWHIPSHEEWTQLEEFIGNVYKIGLKLKAKNGWRPYTTNDSGENKKTLNGNGTDEYGFSALPGGYRWDHGRFSEGEVAGYWWSSTDLKGNGSSSYGMKFSNSTSIVTGRIFDKYKGQSVRCIKD